MAEGHAVIRWARALAVLLDQPLEEVQLPKRWGARAQQLVGEQITAIATHGKHLLLHLSNGETLHTHAMQYGSWQIGARDMALRKEARYVRLRLATATHAAVFFHGPVVELLTADELRTHATLGALGPDVLSPTFDRAEAARRIRAAAGRAIGDVVLDQRAVAGLGNIFKSEGLFLAGLDPRRAAQNITADELDRLWEAVIPLMWRGVEQHGPTTTTTPALTAAGHRHYVYRRRGQPCLRCGTPIQMLRQGALQRTTYFCPVCQR